MSMILNQAQPRTQGLKLRQPLIAAAGTILFFAMMTAFGTSQETVIYSGKLDDVIEHVQIPALQETPKLAAKLAAQAREVRIERGDTVSALLSEMNIQDPALEGFLRTSRMAEPVFRQLAPGKTVTAKISLDGALQSLQFPLNGGKDTALMIERKGDDFGASIQNLGLETNLSLQTAVIRHSLFGATDEAGIPESVATQLADIFGGDIDFHRDLRKGDRLSVIYETTSHMGKPMRTQRILAAEFVNGGKTYHAFWHGHNGEVGGYYTADGRGIKKAFLKSPLEFSRITSGFSNARYHPVLRETRAHRGIDYGAPTGTRVRATGDGVVEFAGSQGGYGKVVIIRHAGEKQTVYGHLSGFASGLKKGQRLSQGEVLGYVGATGLATGPHLHYEFRIAGIHRNPLALALPPAPPLPPDQLASFRNRAEDLMAKISSIRDMQLVMLD